MSHSCLPCYVPSATPVAKFDGRQSVPVTLTMELLDTLLPTWTDRVNMDAIPTNKSALRWRTSRRLLIISTLTPSCITYVFLHVSPMFSMLLAKLPLVDCSSDHASHKASRSHSHIRSDNHTARLLHTHNLCLGFRVPHAGNPSALHDKARDIIK